MITAHDKAFGWVLDHYKDIVSKSLEKLYPFLLGKTKAFEYSCIPEARLLDENMKECFIDLLVLVKLEQKEKPFPVVIEIKSPVDQKDFGETLRQIQRYRGLIRLNTNKREYGLAAVQPPAILITENYIGLGGKLPRHCQIYVYKPKNREMEQMG